MLEREGSMPEHVVVSSRAVSRSSSRWPSQDKIDREKSSQQQGGPSAAAAGHHEKAEREKGKGDKERGKKARPGQEKIDKDKQKGWINEDKADNKDKNKGSAPAQQQQQQQQDRQEEIKVKKWSSQDRIDKEDEPVELHRVSSRSNVLETDAISVYQVGKKPKEELTLPNGKSVPFAFLVVPCRVVLLPSLTAE